MRIALLVVVGVVLLLRWRSFWLFLWLEEWIPLGPFAPYVLGLAMRRWPRKVK
jgi:hypothetical protein